jgi:hypothetical protein
MKIHFPLFSLGCSVIGVAIITTLAGVPVFAQQSTTIALAPDTGISLPPGWKVTSQAPDEALPQGVHAGVTDPQSASLLLTAAPTDTKRNLSISLYSIHFREWGPPLGAGEMGAESEAEKLLHAVLMQSFKPGDVRVNRSTTATGKPLITIEISAKNAAGEERVFTDVAVASKPAPSILRLYASRPATDAVGAREIAAIIQSFTVQGDTGGLHAGNTRIPAPATSPPPIGGMPGLPAPAPPGAANSPAATPDSVPASTSPTMPGNAPGLARAGQLVNDYRTALILVEGQKGAGSGFLCHLEGHTFAITNAHVLSDNIGFRLTSLDGATFTAGGSAVAVGHDMVRMEVPGVAQAFEVMPNLDSDVKIGDSVVVPGNAEGARVVRPVEGKIVGIGPNLIEVDAPFVKGNSGSPIIHQATGKVLGIATYLVQRKISQGERQEVTVETRRFGYRLDSVKTWEPINWQAFFAQSAQVAQMEDLSKDFARMFEDLRTTHDLVPANYSSEKLRHSIKSFLEDVNRRGLSRTDKEDLLRRFFADLRSITRSDIAAFNTRTAYDYFHREVEKESLFRENIYNVFTRLMQNPGE